MCTLLNRNEIVMRKKIITKKREISPKIWTKGIGTSKYKYPTKRIPNITDKKFLFREKIFPKFIIYIKYFLLFEN